MGFPPLKIEHGHGLNLCAIRDAGFYTGAAFEYAQERGPFRAAMQLASVIARLNQEPGGEASIFMFVGSDSELQRIDAMGERGGALPICF